MRPRRQQEPFLPNNAGTPRPDTPSAIRHSAIIRRSGSRKRLETRRRKCYTQRQSLPGVGRQAYSIGGGVWNSGRTRQPAASPFTGRGLAHFSVLRGLKNATVPLVVRERLRQPLFPQASPDQTRTLGRRKEIAHSEPPRVRASTQANSPFTALPSRVTPSARSSCLFAVGSMGTAPLFAWAPRPAKSDSPFMLCHGLG